jgi:hypothetical protein
MARGMTGTRLRKTKRENPVNLEPADSMINSNPRVMNLTKVASIHLKAPIHEGPSDLGKSMVMIFEFN